MKNLKLSERFMYYSGLLVAMKGTDVIDDLTHISDLLDAEEQGLLLRLPCKVGDAVYTIEDGEICKYKSPYDSTEIRKENGEYIFCIDSMDFRKEDFGETVFLTKAEAEKKLAEMGE